MPAVSLPDFQQQIAAREHELQTLRQELESRQAHLTELTRRKEELQRQLQQIEEEITALAAATPTKTERPRTVAPTTPPTPDRAASVRGQPRLGELILTMLGEADGPMTARQLSEEARRRGFQSAARDPVKAVEARLQVLKNKGVVRRASGQPDYLRTPTAHHASKDKSKAGQTAHTNTPKAVNKPAKAVPVVLTVAQKGQGADRKSRPAPTSVW